MKNTVKTLIFIWEKEKEKKLDGTLPVSY